MPKEVNIASPKGNIIDDILFTHGHTLPTENYSNVSKIVMGHLHPVFFQKESIINGKRVWVSIKCSKDKVFPSQTGDMELIIVPAFNKYFHTIKNLTVQLLVMKNYFRIYSSRNPHMVLMLFLWVCDFVTILVFSQMILPIQW